MTNVTDPKLPPAAVTYVPPATRHDGAIAVAEALKLLEGRWKLAILFRLFGERTLRFSELHREIEGVSEKMLIQQLRQLESAGLLRREAYPEVPPRVEYSLTSWGQSLCPILDSLLRWSAARPC